MWRISQSESVGINGEVDDSVEKGQSRVRDENHGQWFKLVLTEEAIVKN